MSEISSQVSPRVVSFGTLLQPRLILAQVASWTAALALAIAILAAATIVCVVSDSQSGKRLETETGGLSSLAAHMPPGFHQDITRQVADTHTWWQHDRSTIILLMAVVTLSLLFRWALRYYSGESIAEHVESETQRLRQHLHRKAIRLEPADVSGDQASVADRLFRESTSALQQASQQRGLIMLTTLPDGVVMFLTAMAVNWRVGFETLVPVVVGWFGIRAESSRTEATARLLTEQVNRGLQRLAEGLRKTRLVAGYAMEELEQQQFEQNLSQYRQRCRRLRRQRKLGVWICRLIALVCVAVPAWLMIRHLLPPGDLRTGGAFAIVCAGVVLYGALKELQGAPELATEGGVRSEEIASYIARVPSVGQVPGARFFEPMSRSLLFDQICLRTPQNSELLQNLDLKISYGDRIALLSLNPSAARALASMIPRFVDPDSGQVLLDGNDIRSATLESIRAECVFVGGDDPVFNATILENISCGHKDITRQQIIEAAKTVHADNFIRRLPKGYDTVVGEHGAALDPGQVFRLSLARAVVRSPAILIIEEPAIAMDTETKAMIDDAYQRIWSDRTMLFLPTRLSTVKRCTRVVMIHEGRVAADASHEKLVRSSDLYRHWEYHHFNAFKEDS